MLTYELREQMRENALELAESFLIEEVPFRLVLWNNDNWNMGLPDETMENFPVQLVLDIKDASLNDSFLDIETGEFVIVTIFEGIEYHKVLEAHEIIAILDTKGQPFIVNNFPQDDEEHLDNIVLPKTKDDLIDNLTMMGLEKENAKKSVDSFLQNNSEIKEEYK